jgi:hypothetical protein
MAELGLISEMVIDLHDSSDTATVARSAVKWAPRLLPGVAASITLSRHRNPVPRAASHAELAAADQEQVDLGEGPAVHVLRSCPSVLVTDLSSWSPWKRWGPRAVELGWRNLLTVRLSSRSGNTLGAFTIAHPSPGVLDCNATDTASLLAVHLSVAIDSARINENLRQAGDSHLQVGRALGILMERYDITADQAFAVLRRYSRELHRKLRDIADEVVTSRRLPELPAATMEQCGA